MQRSTRASVLAAARAKQPKENNKLTATQSTRPKRKRKEIDIQQKFLEAPAPTAATPPAEAKKEKPLKRAKTTPTTSTRVRLGADKKASIAFKNAFPNRKYIPGALNLETLQKGKLFAAHLPILQGGFGLFLSQSITWDEKKDDFQAIELKKTLIEYTGKKIKTADLPPPDERSYIISINDGEEDEEEAKTKVKTKVRSKAKSKAKSKDESEEKDAVDFHIDATENGNGACCGNNGEEPNAAFEWNRVDKCTYIKLLKPIILDRDENGKEIPKQIILNYGNTGYVLPSKIAIQAHHIDKTYQQIFDKKQDEYVELHTIPNPAFRDCITRLLKLEEEKAETETTILVPKFMIPDVRKTKSLLTKFNVHDTILVGKKVGEKFIINHDQLELNALMLACYQNDIPRIQDLINHHVDSRFAMDFSTLLHFVLKSPAPIETKIKTFQFLLDEKNYFNKDKNNSLATPMVEDNNNETIYHLCIKDKNPDAFRLLEELCLSFDFILSDFSKSPIKTAVEEENYPAAALLITASIEQVLHLSLIEEIEIEKLLKEFKILIQEIHSDIKNINSDQWAQIKIQLVTLKNNKYDPAIKTWIDTLIDATPTTLLAAFEIEIKAPEEVSIVEFKAESKEEKAAPKKADVAAPTKKIAIKKERAAVRKLKITAAHTEEDNTPAITAEVSPIDATTPIDDNLTITMGRKPRTKKLTSKAKQWIAAAEDRPIFHQGQRLLPTHQMIQIHSGVAPTLEPQSTAATLISSENHIKVYNTAVQLQPGESEYEASAFLFRAGRLGIGQKWTQWYTGQIKVRETAYPNLSEKTMKDIFLTFLENTNKQDAPEQLTYFLKNNGTEIPRRRIRQDNTHTKKLRKPRPYSLSSDTVLRAYKRGGIFLLELPLQPKEKIKNADQFLFLVQRLKKEDKWNAWFTHQLEVREAVHGDSLTEKTMRHIFEFIKTRKNIPGETSLSDSDMVQPVALPDEQIAASATDSESKLEAKADLPVIDSPPTPWTIAKHLGSDILAKHFSSLADTETAVAVSSDGESKTTSADEPQLLPAIPSPSSSSSTMFTMSAGLQLTPNQTASNKWYITFKLQPGELAQDVTNFVKVLQGTQLRGMDAWFKGKLLIQKHKDDPNLIDICRDRKVLLPKKTMTRNFTTLSEGTLIKLYQAYLKNNTRKDKRYVPALLAAIAPLVASLDTEIAVTIPMTIANESKLEAQAKTESPPTVAITTDNDNNDNDDDEPVAMKTEDDESAIAPVAPIPQYSSSSSSGLGAGNGFSMFSTTPATDVPASHAWNPKSSSNFIVIYGKKFYLQLGETIEEVMLFKRNVQNRQNRNTPDENKVWLDTQLFNAQLNRTLTQKTMTRLFNIVAQEHKPKTSAPAIPQEWLDSSIPIVETTKLSEATERFLRYTTPSPTHSLGGQSHFGSHSATHSGVAPQHSDAMKVEAEEVIIDHYLQPAV